ncbi:RHS repeat-associated core domain-containing protein [Pseudomonas ogarae]|uniref:RHS repeat-associated core domain-containing protein n=1 Tax=Pseudomonas ogarae (strain DSM 112162 / CECT 30235 / F113) TaxID=1114970 RepID=UPI001CEC1873|nr:RHS repeat-associated core domain-containing protein [Pseudomonas zarinae]
MSTSSMKILCRYQYDPLDRLTGLRPAEHVGTQRFYQTDDLVNEIEGQIQLTILRHEAQPLAQRLNIANVAETTLLATDQQRSVLQTLTATDTRHLVYTAYGHQPAESGLSSLLGFNGERPDPITGHYLLGQGNRAFNPVLMRFNSPDELSPFGDGGINPYAYCGGDPVNRYDPSGNIFHVINPRSLPPRTPTLMQTFPNRILRPTAQTIQKTRAAPKKIWLDQYSQTQSATISEEPSALPAELPFTPLTPMNAPETPPHTRNMINRLAHEGREYDKAIETHPAMRTWTDTPTRNEYNLAKERLRRLIAERASEKKIKLAEAELTLAQWKAKSSDLYKFLKTHNSEIRRR